MTLEAQHVTQQTIPGCLLMRVHDRLSRVLVASAKSFRLVMMPWMYQIYQSSSPCSNSVGCQGCPLLKICLLQMTSLLQQTVLGSIDSTQWARPFEHYAFYRSALSVTADDSAFDYLDDIRLTWLCFIRLSMDATTDVLTAHIGNKHTSSFPITFETAVHIRVQ
jgi:hypothetical protein